jgi:pyrroloquinoline quinone biosynthesis protein B
MWVHVLGAGAGGGFPQWNCNCRNCAGVRCGRIRARPRTQSSIAVTGNGEGWVLVNASPDILAQLRDFPALQPGRAVRDTALVAVVLVDSQIDHTTGLLMLREGDPLRVYCTASVHDDLTTGNPLFTVLAHYCGVEWQPVAIDADARFRIPGAGTLSFRAIGLTSRAPPYSPHRETPRADDTIGLEITDETTGRSLFYAPGIGRADLPVTQALQEADCVLVDGTFWTDDEMARQDIAPTRAAEMGHLAQSGDGGMLAVLGAHARGRKVLIHVNNTNPILDEDSAERAQLAAAGVEVAYDGMEIAL